MSALLLPTQIVTQPLAVPQREVVVEASASDPGPDPFADPQPQTVTVLDKGKNVVRQVEEETRSHENIKASVEEVWYLKEISFRPVPDAAPRMYKIITQNFNGPCSFIAICNILILRDKIQILPYDRPAVSYEQLSHLVAEYLLLSCPDVDISAALSVMPATRKGMDLNPLFTGATSFRPAGAGGELKLFEQAGIQLVHGWLVDPSSPEYRAMSQLEDYDTAVNLIVEADHLTKGQLMVAEPDQAPASSSSSASPGPSGTRSNTYDLTPEQQQKVEDALVVRSFLSSSASQLTYYGLFSLAASLAPNSLVALFRNSHLSVLYKSHEGDGALYTLVTDHVFLNESSVVWERLEDVDGRWSAFVDSRFVQSSPAGGDYAGHTAESALAAMEQDFGAMALTNNADAQLARQMQQAEEQRMQEYYARQELLRADREQQRHGRAPNRPTNQQSPRLRSWKECIVM